MYITFLITLVCPTSHLWKSNWLQINPFNFKSPLIWSINHGCPRLLQITVNYRNPQFKIAPVIWIILSTNSFSSYLTRIPQQRAISKVQKRKACNYLVNSGIDSSTPEPNAQSKRDAPTPRPSGKSKSTQEKKRRSIRHRHTVLDTAGNIITTKRNENRPTEQW